MLIRTRLNILFLIALSLIAIGLIISSFFVTEYLNQRVLNSEERGTKAVWNKIENSSFEKMAFYAYDDTPGKPSIWRLRGNRSPIDAIRSKDVRKLERTIVPMYKNLQKSNILDFLIISDKEEIIFQKGLEASSQNKNNRNSLNYFSVITEQLFKKKIDSIFLKINDKVAHIVHFPVYINGRIIARVYYGKWLNALIEDIKFSSGVEAILFDENRKTIYTTDIDIDLEKIKRLTLAGQGKVEKISNSHFLINQITLNEFLNQKVYFSLVRDVTKARKNEFYFSLIIISIIIVFLIIITVIINILLYKNFRPLYSAIDVLNGLILGKTDQKVDVSASGEVGQIAKAVEAFRQSIITSNTDALTGLPNRRNILNQIENSLKNYLSNSIPSFCIIIADIDNFKNVNDTFGHNAGDEVLTTLAKIAESVMRNQDIFARYGGEEFLAIIYDSDLKAAHTVSERIRTAVENTKIILGGKERNITITIGVACVTESNHLSSLLELADKRLYTGKDSGKNKSVYK